MKRLLLDSSVYGELILDEKTLGLLITLYAKHEVVLYGNNVIRQELKDTPKKVKQDNKSKKMLLLQLYDSFIRKQNHNIPLGHLAEVLAQEYFKVYKLEAGSLSFEELVHDFLIVASASLKELDIVVSHDEKSLLSPPSLAAYKQVNQCNGLRNPQFYKYNAFKKVLNFVNLPV
ncbi:hypothetical protein HZB01_05545 [Candidatus Woesearchaeota archaeon]|nr:hypothetical protein [Candidatus Woesearchaeota archaeon]